METNSGVPKVFLQTFDNSFRERVHLLIELGYKKARNKFNSKTQETHITSHITEAIQEIFEDPISGSLWIDFDIDEDSLVKKENTYGRSKPRVDIVIKFCAGSPRPKFNFEAKRLKTNSSTTGDYVGLDGLMCFVNGHYSDQFPEASMLGYVQSDTIAQWKIKVQNAIIVDALPLELDGTQTDYYGINALPDEWISNHKRSVLGRPIIVYHILLDCV